MWKRNESLDEDSDGFVREAEREGFSLESGESRVCAPATNSRFLPP